MTQTQLAADEAREALYEVMKQDCSFETKAERALAIGERYFGVDNGHLTKIDPESDYWKTIASTDGPDGGFPPGLVLDLDTTYCRRTISQSEPVTLHDAPNQGWSDDPAFDAHGLHCYHGTTISLDEEPYGTVCFVSEQPRSEPFTDEETMFAELIARMLEHELQREQTAAKVERLEGFAAILSHDLRNPLQVSLARVEAARTDGDTEHLEVAMDALDRMDRLISDVLDMARQGRDIEDTDAVTLSAMAEQSWQVVEADGTELVLDGDITFRAAPDRLKHLFENLFRNAIEHGGADVAVRVGPLDDREGFFVEDDGPGIPEPQRDEAFEAGYSTGDDGIGIGLSIVDSVVTAHEWRITVTDSAGGGARFEIRDVIVLE